MNQPKCSLDSINTPATADATRRRSVSVVAIGGGGGGTWANADCTSGGGGGGLGWANNIQVVPGQVSLAQETFTLLNTAGCFEVHK